MAQEESRSEGQLLQIHEVRIHGLKEADPALKGGSSHGVDEAFGFYNLKVSNNLTTDTSEVSKDEGGESFIHYCGGQEF